MSTFDMTFFAKPDVACQKEKDSVVLLSATSRGSEEMSSELQGRVDALQEQLAVAMAEQEVEASRVRGEEVTPAEEAGRGKSSQDEEPEALRARGAEMKGSLKVGGGRPAMDGAF